MGRELKKVFHDERTDKIMANIYTAFEGYELAKKEDLTNEEWMIITDHLWKTCEVLMRAGDIWDVFEKYCTIQQEGE